MTESILTKRTLFSLIFSGLCFILLSTGSVHAQENATGRTWLDNNLNGQIDEGEAGLEGVLVIGQDETGQKLETTTAEDGAWSLGPFAGKRLLIQFVLPQDGPLADYRPTQAGWANLQAINLGERTEEINAGFFDPAGYCAANPELVVTRFSAGDPLSTEGIDGGRTRDFTSVFAFPYALSLIHI